MATRRSAETAREETTRRRPQGARKRAGTRHAADDTAQGADVRRRARGGSDDEHVEVAGASAQAARAGRDEAARADVGREARARRGEEHAPRMPRMLTPEQAIELYKANARLALDVIDAALEGAERVRRKQFEGEQQARALSRKHARAAAVASDPASLFAAGQGAAHEAVETSLRYWQEMFELIVEIQKRLFTLIEEQTGALPGAREARAALALMPDLTGMQKVVEAMQGVVTSGGGAFENMQRAMSDFARMAQGSMRGRG
jgi:phasin family protein